MDRKTFQKNGTARHSSLATRSAFAEKVATMIIERQHLKDAICNAIGFEKFRSRSHDAVIRVYDSAATWLKRKSTRAISGSGELAVTSIGSSNLSSVSLLTGTIPKQQANCPLVRITNNRTGHVFYSRTHDHISRLSHLALSGLLISMCRQPKSGPPTKPDNTQSGHVEIREVDIVLLLPPHFDNGEFNEGGNKHHETKTNI
jgi:hypothetical protein